jgi:phosphate transport system substrate-binding protein
MMNKDGQYVAPSEKSFAAAAAGADWFSVPGMGISLVEQKGASTWPITGASFVLMYKEPADKAASKDVIKFFTWAFKDGQQLALDLDYVPLPDALTKAIASKVWSQVKN